MTAGISGVVWTAELGEQRVRRQRKARYPEHWSNQRILDVQAILRRRLVEVRPTRRPAQRFDWETAKQVP